MDHGALLTPAHVDVELEALLDIHQAPLGVGRLVLQIPCVVIDLDNLDAVLRLALPENEREGQLLRPAAEGPVLQLQLLHQVLLLHKVIPEDGGRPLADLVLRLLSLLC